MTYYKSKYQWFTSGRKKVGIKELKILKCLLIIHKQLMMFMKIYKLKSNKEKKSVISVWWYDSRYES